MKNRFTKLIITMLIFLVACASFVACNDGESSKKYDYLVTFNYNVGQLGTIESQYLGVKDGSLVAIKPGYSDAYKEGSLKGYYLEGWYTAKTDSDGNVIVGEDGRVALDEKWNFDTDTVSEDIVLYANFVQQASLIIKGGDEDKVFTGTPGSTRKEPTSVLAPKKAGYTFLGYYADENYTEKFEWPYVYEAGEKTIYALFMEGVWSIVTTPKEFSLALAQNKNIYLASDLDFSDTDWPLAGEYSSEIAGNGHTISGINFEIEANKNTKKFALFGALTETAKLHDFTIENVTVTFSDGGFATYGYEISMIATEIKAGAQLTNLTVTGVMEKGSVEESSEVNFYAVTAKDDGAVITNCNFDGVILPE